MEKPGITRRGKLLIIVGARPQFIKAAAMSWAIQAWNSQPDRPGFEEIIIHTGQHYDYDLSQSFFDELAIPNPHFNLNVKSASHAVQTAKMMMALEALMQDIGPDWVIVFGDTNSTLAGVLSAAKLKIPIAHVEAGLREHNRHIPEEVNKIVAEHLRIMYRRRDDETGIGPDQVIEFMVPDCRLGRGMQGEQDRKGQLSKRLQDIAE